MCYLKRKPNLSQRLSEAIDTPTFDLELSSVPEISVSITISIHSHTSVHFY